jgi:hypothetical protein
MRATANRIAANINKRGHANPDVPQRGNGAAGYQAGPPIDDYIPAEYPLDQYANRNRRHHDEQKLQRGLYAADCTHAHLVAEAVHVCISPQNPCDVQRL